MVLCTTDISFHPGTFETSDKVEDVYEAKSSKTFSCVDVVLSHPMPVGFSQDELVEELLYLIADCCGVCVQNC